MNLANTWITPDAQDDYRRFVRNYSGGENQSARAEVSQRRNGIFGGARPGVHEAAEAELLERLKAGEVDDDLLVFGWFLARRQLEDEEAGYAECPF